MRLASYTGQSYRDHLDEKAPVDVREPELFLKAGETIAPPGVAFEVIDGRNGH
jgi:hypothetical protein